MRDQRNPMAEAAETARLGDRHGQRPDDEPEDQYRYAEPQQAVAAIGGAALAVVGHRRQVAGDQEEIADHEGLGEGGEHREAEGGGRVAG